MPENISRPKPRRKRVQIIDVKRRFSAPAPVALNCDPRSQHYEDQALTAGPPLDPRSLLGLRAGLNSASPRPRESVPLRGPAGPYFRAPDLFRGLTPRPPESS